MGFQKVLEIVHNALPPKALFRLHEAGMRQIHDIQFASATVSGWKDWKDELGKARIYYGPMINLSRRPTKFDNPWWSRPAIVDEYAMLDTDTIREALELVSVSPRGQRQLQSHFSSALSARSNMMPLSGLLLPRMKKIHRQCIFVCPFSYMLPTMFEIKYRHIYCSYVFLSTRCCHCLRLRVNSIVWFTLQYIPFPFFVLRNTVYNNQIQTP